LCDTLKKKKLISVQGRESVLLLLFALQAKFVVNNLAIKNMEPGRSEREVESVVVAVEGAELDSECTE